MKLSGAFFVYFFSYQVYYRCLDLEDRCLESARYREQIPIDLI